jgi:hypothetical protein
VVLSGSGDPAVPAVTIVQSAKTRNNASSLAFTGSVTAGNLLLVAFGASTSGGFTSPIVVSDTLGCTPWVQQVNAQNSNQPNMTAIATCVTASSGADTVSVTGAGGNDSQLIVAEISGNYTVTADTTGTTVYPGNSPPTLSLTVPYDLLFTSQFQSGATVAVTSPEAIVQNITGNFWQLTLAYVMKSTVGSVASSLTGGRPYASVALLANSPVSPGVNGDWYLNTTTGILWGPKTGGLWSKANITALDSVSLCTGFTPTNGQLLQYTTGGSPNPCWTAATAGGGTIPNTTQTLKGDGSGNAAGIGSSSTDCVHPDGSSGACIASSATTVNSQTCALGGSCTVTAAPSGSAGGDLASTYPSPTVANLSNVSNGSLANAGLAHPATTVNGQTCTLGSTCTTGGYLGAPIGNSPTSNAILYGDASGNLQNAAGITRTGTGQLTLGTAGSPGNEIDLGTAATDSASLGSELTTSGTCTGTGWTGTYPNYVAPGTTNPLTCTGFTSGMFYQTVTTIGAGGSGAVTIAIGTAQTASGSSGTVTAGLKANGTSLTYTPVSTYTGTIGISAKLITPISMFTVTGKDSTGAVSGVVLWQTLASLHNSFSGGGGSYNTTGTNNSAQGYQALYSNTTGYYNSAQGVQALYSNTTGYYNSAQGYQALYINTTGINNSAQGVSALYSNTTGINNSAQGYQALFNTTGIDNSAQGVSALYSNTTGSSNSAQGVQAGYTATGANANTTGSDNSWFGFNSGPGSPTQYNYQSVIGAAATGTCSNCVVLGRSGGQDTVYAGDAGVDPMVVIALATTPVLTTNLKTCTATTGIPWRASVTDATAPALGAPLTGGGTVFANVHCSLTSGTYIVDGI